MRRMRSEGEEQGLGPEEGKKKKQTKDRCAEGEKEREEQE